MNGGAYRLFLRLPVGVELEVGRFGRHRLAAGYYVYIGSARRALDGRVGRHSRLATEKRGNRHWHIDALLLHPHSQLIRSETFAGADECVLSQELAAAPGVSVPLPGFGATDCRAGCASHLYKVDGRRSYARMVSLD